MVARRAPRADQGHLGARGYLGPRTGTFEFGEWRGTSGRTRAPLGRMVTLGFARAPSEKDSRRMPHGNSKRPIGSREDVQGLTRRGWVPLEGKLKFRKGFSCLGRLPWIWEGQFDPRMRTKALQFGPGRTSGFSRAPPEPQSPSTSMDGASGSNSSVKPPTNISSAAGPPQALAAPLP